MAMQVSLSEVELEALVRVGVAYRALLCHERRRPHRMRLAAAASLSARFRARRFMPLVTGPEQSDFEWPRRSGYVVSNMRA